MRAAERGVLVGLLPPHPHPLAGPGGRAASSLTPPWAPQAPTRPFPTPQGPREHGAVGRPPWDVAGRRLTTPGRGFRSWSLLLGCAPQPQSPLL